MMLNLLIENRRLERELSNVVKMSIRAEGKSFSSGGKQELKMRKTQCRIPRTLALITATSDLQRDPTGV